MCNYTSIVTNLEPLIVRLESQICTHIQKHTDRHNITKHNEQKGGFIDRQSTLKLSEIILVKAILRNNLKFLLRGLRNQCYVTGFIKIFGLTITPFYTISYTLFIAIAATVILIMWLMVIGVV